MYEETIDSHKNDHEIELENKELSFKIEKFIQNDLLLSLLYFGLILFLPLLIWDHVDQTLIYRWQGCMIAITATRWICRFVLTNNNGSFWSGVFTFLTLLDGLGWGVLAALFLPVDSILAICMTTLLLIGIGGLGAVSYSSRMLIATPYLLCVISPYIVRLYTVGGDAEFLIASSLSLLVIMFSFTADRLNINLTSALRNNGRYDKYSLAMKKVINRLESNLEETKNYSKDLENQVVKNTQELENVHKIIYKHRENLYLFIGNLINLLNDLESLKQTNLDQHQNKIIGKIETNARHLSKTLNETDEPHDVENIQQLSVNIEDNSTDNLENIRVLVINDNQQETEIIKQCLLDLNVNYQVVENAPAALAVLCKAGASMQKFDLVIASTWMPDMDGISFSDCLQNDPEFQEIKIILISCGEFSDEKILQKVGVDLVISQPFKSEELIRGINNLTGKKTSELPASITALIDDAIQISLPVTGYENQTINSSPTMNSCIIDQYVIDGLRSSTTTNFIEIVNEFLEEVPRLIEQAKIAYGENNNLEIQKIIRELGSRSVHLGASSLIKSAKKIDEIIESHGIERVMGMLQSIETEFIQVESALLSELTNGILLSSELKH